MAIPHLRLILFVILIYFLKRRHTIIMGDLNQDIESIFVACFSNKTKKKGKILRKR